MSFRIEHRIGIAAPAPVVWDVLADLPGWSEWNPLHGHIEGELRINGRLLLNERMSGREQPVAVTVVDWVPNEQILWRSSAFGAADESESISSATPSPSRSSSTASRRPSPHRTHAKV